MAANPRMHSLAEVIATRSIARFYKWILAGLVILYLLTFPIFKSPILIAVPVIVAGWFFYSRGGILGSILAAILNTFLFNQFIGQVSWGFLFDLSNGFLVGHLFVAVFSSLTGYLRTVFENLYQLNRRLQSQERFLTLSNMIVRKILSASKPDRLFDDIVNHLTNLFVADYGCIIRLDPIQEKMSLIVATNSIKGSSLNIELDPNEGKLIQQVLQTGQALLIEEAEGTLQITKHLRLTGSFRQAKSAICLPLVAREYKFGAAILAFESPQNYTSEDRARAERIGYQIALALWTMRQDEISLQQLNETKTLMQIGQALGETERIGLAVVLQLIVDSARKLIPQADRTVIHLLDEDGKSLIPKATSGFNKYENFIPNVKMQIGDGAAGQVLRNGITINIADVDNDPRFLPTNTKPTYRSLLVSPVQTAGEQLGTISVESEKISAFTEDEAELLKALGVQAAIAIENTRLFETTQQRLKEVNTLYQISRSLAGSLDVDQLIRDMISLLQQSFDYYHVQIYMIDPERGDLVVEHGSGSIGSELVNRRYRVPAGEGIVGHVAETGAPFMTNNVEALVFFKRNDLLPHTQFEIAVPIKVDDLITGVLDIQQTPDRNRFTDADLHLMTAIADQLAVVLQKAALYSNLQTSLQHEQEIRSQLLQSERLALVGRLLASVSHELNNPLQAIQNALFLLKEESNLSHQARQDLNVILAEADRMAALIERLRGAYRPVRSNDFQSVELNSLIEDVHALISTHMRHKEITFEFHPESELIPTSGLPDQMRQVVLNLFLNAIEIMNPGGRLCVWTRNLPQQNEVLLTVKDTGPGINPEILPRIFEAFTTTKPTGTGLGLAITHDIIQQHRGRIQAENDPQGGAIFKVWLPVCKEGEA